MLGARNVLWQLRSTDHSAIFVETDVENRVTALTAFLREGKELPSLADDEKVRVNRSSRDLPAS